MSRKFIGCTIKTLPEAAFAPVANPEHIAVMRDAYWGEKGVDLSVQFLDGPDAETRRMILDAEIGANAWGKRANIRFRETSQQGQIRITRDRSGYWSYLGTGLLRVQGATMNLQGFTSKTPVSEYRRVVKHEFGHCLDGDTLIDCPRDLNKYPGGIPIKDLVGSQPWVYAWKNGQLAVCKASRVWLSRKAAKVVRVRLKPGRGLHTKAFLPPQELVGTPEHLVLLSDGKTWKAMGSLQPGDSLCSMYRSKNGRRSRIRWTGSADRVREHVFVCEQVYGPRPTGHDSHHKNERMMDQSPENLEWKDESLHYRDHSTGRKDTEETRIKRVLASTGRLHTDEAKKKMAEAARNRPPISEETRRRISAATKGKKQPEELVKKRAAAMNRFYANGGKSGMFGKTASNETRAKRSASMKATLAAKREKAIVNHTVVSVEELVVLRDVYDMTVPGADSFVANGVVVHNSLGFPHEHMRADLVARLDRAKTIDYFARTQGWSERDVMQQVLTPLSEASLMATPADQTSVMCYQLPGSITRDGKPIPGGPDINESDLAFAAKIYPLPPAPPIVVPPTTSGEPATMVILDASGRETARFKLTRIPS